MKVAGRRRGAKSWFVEPYRQVKLGLMVVVINVLFSCLIFGVFGYYLWDVYATVAEYFNLSESQAQTAFHKFAMPAIVGGGLIIAFVITTILVSVKYTHQIYGPLVSIHRFLDQIIVGQRPDALQLRESDQLKELAEKLNQIAERLGAGNRQAPLVPVYRFLDDLLAGNKPTPLQLRGGDQMTELVEKLNKLAEKLPT